jgi:hypothetical protein
MQSEQYFSGDIMVVFADGSRELAKLTADEVCVDSKEIHRISLQQGGKSQTAESDIDFFEALKLLRLELEKSGILVACLGASENVYPSGMQRSMGPAILAYRMSLGSPALQKDIVNIFDADETVILSTVEQQERFHRRWFESLGASSR